MKSRSARGAVSATSAPVQLAPGRRLSRDRNVGAIFGRGAVLKNTTHGQRRGHGYPRVVVGGSRAGLTRVLDSVLHAMARGYTIGGVLTAFGATGSDLSLLPGGLLRKVRHENP